MTTDLQEWAMYAFEWQIVANPDVASLLLTWRRLVPGGAQYKTVLYPAPVEMTGYELNLQTQYGALRDALTDAGYDVTDLMGLAGVVTPPPP